MIFPSVRLSQLERDVEDKRRAFENSQSAFASLIRHKARPVVFVREHPRLLLGSAFTLLTSSKLASKALHGLFSRKGSLFWKILKAGWAWKVAKLAGRTILRRGLPKGSSPWVNLLSALLAFRRS